MMIFGNMRFAPRREHQAPHFRPGFGQRRVETQTTSKPRETDCEENVMGKQMSFKCGTECANR